MITAADNSILKVQPLEANALKLFFESMKPLKEHFESPEVAEIMINDFRNIYVEHRGRMQRLELELNQSTLKGAIHALAASVDKSARAGTEKGIINAGHANLRVAAVMRPTAIDGDALSIRKHREQHLSLSDYVQMGAFSRAVARTADESPIFLPGVENEALRGALAEMVRRRKNVLVAGGTSTGKTTLLNALNAEIPPDERVITIEDTQELKVLVPNRVRLLSNLDKGVSTQLLVALCLRLRPDRIIVGEVRGPEAYDFLQALNTGHDGGMGSIHANSAGLALTRLEDLVMQGAPVGAQSTLSAVRRNVAACFDYVLHMRRTGEMRHLSEIVEIRGVRHDEYVLERVF